ncbi:transcriptional regulator [Gemmobacter lanyuensis]|uniref:Transcriptional regulator n=1 Tax=Gemmobacter lanyuensis TaxID=1054497 RepID=A0A918MIE4_9RHOB|nr:S24 family peptidase [Gemmobacter lanyuensis]GGW24088.1 transcriptional regulator [Gemmobacter lanyuensis]
MRRALSAGTLRIMENSFKEALEVALKITGRSLRSVAIASGVSYEQLKGLKQGKASSTNVDDAMRVARAFGVTLDDFYTGRLGATQSVAVAGRVGAGAEVVLSDDHAKGDGLYHVACPPQLAPRGVVAVEVVGDSMEPVFYEGDILFYSRQTIGIPTEAIGRPCICEDYDGLVWVKQVKVGTSPGLFNLLSINPTGTNRLDVALKWAAPVLFHLPMTYVTKL